MRKNPFSALLCWRFTTTSVYGVSRMKLRPTYTVAWKPQLPAVPGPHQNGVAVLSNLIAPTNKTQEGRERTSCPYGKVDIFGAEGVSHTVIVLRSYTSVTTRPPRPRKLLVEVCGVWSLFKFNRNLNFKIAEMLHTVLMK